MTTEINLTCSNKGIGDAVIAFYVALALSRHGQKVNYYTHCHKWFEPLMRNIDLASNNIEVLEYRANAGIDLFDGFSKEYKGDYTTRIQRYIENAYIGLNMVAGFEIPPAGEGINRDIAYLNQPQQAASEPSPWQDYILIAPFASVKGRQWPVFHVARLVRLLAESGEKVAIIGSMANAPAIKSAFTGLPCKAFIGEAPAEIIARMRVCKMLIGIDSAMAHIGNLYRIPTWVIMAQLPFQFIFDEHTRADTTKGIVPAAKCSPCFFQAPVHTKECQTLGCSAMGSISVERVFNLIEPYL